ncbi:redox-sensitive transcriptional activator SoxR [Glacieibacterium frigidum]|uniref:Redox-sensitive transcriptional activator SoxR n=1 Tax=Glacieibacterium frigidum TaxID=2593303 RepID=A0A552U8C7_9SPHN|nr:redox-sensitive transcriptional activator SoxR [Glacieibacterium frigidum]TRW14475.1 redox-sensitive transcriptional activator SoxR [Glacieibacterium frigidum]
MLDVTRELTVGDVARRSGVSVSTLHFYEEKGLIYGRRTSGNQRRYGRDVLRFVAVIKVAQRAGIPLKDIKSALAQLPNSRTPTKEDWARLTRSWSDMLQARIDSLTQLRDQFESCIGCGCLSLAVCPLRNPDDALAQSGPGPRVLIDTNEAERVLS